MAAMILVISGDVVILEGVKGSEDYCAVNPHPADCLINPARGYPGWHSRAACQGSKPFSSGWSPSCPGSSKKKGPALGTF